MGQSRRIFLKVGGLTAGAALGGFFVHRVRDLAPELLRPPGAGTEREFLAACLRCGQCIEACPTQILLLAGVESGIAMGTPYLVAREKPCNLCQGQPELKCIAVCPTDALGPVARRRDIRMGIARIDQETCLPWLGVACKACWHACPFPNEAIVFDNRGRAVVVEEACVGCGLCEYACLTEPTSIRVEPHREASIRAADSKTG